MTPTGHLNTHNITSEKIKFHNFLTSFSYSFCLIILFMVDSIFFFPPPSIQGTWAAPYSSRFSPSEKQFENIFACDSEGIQPFNIKLLRNSPDGEHKHLLWCQGSSFYRWQVQEIAASWPVPELRWAVAEGSECCVSPSSSTCFLATIFPLLALVYPFIHLNNH